MIKDKSLSTHTHDLTIGQPVMYREPNNGRCYPATVIQQLQEKKLYLIKTHDNVIYRKMQVHLKPYTPKKKGPQPELSKVDNNQSINIKQQPKCNIKTPTRLNI